MTCVAWMSLSLRHHKQDDDDDDWDWCYFGVAEGTAWNYAHSLLDSISADQFARGDDDDDDDDGR